MAATGAMPMPGDVVMYERLEAALLGIATQIATVVAEPKIEFTGLITEAELRWQAKLAEQLEEQTAAGAPAGLVFLREEIARNKSSADDVFRAARKMQRCASYSRPSRR